MEFSREKDIANGILIYYLLELRSLFLDFSDKNTLVQHVGLLNVNITDNDLNNIDRVIDIVQKHEPSITVKLFYTKQAMQNIRTYIKSIDSIDENKNVIFSWISTDSKKAISFVDECIKDSFYNLKYKSKKSILKNSDFKSYLSKNNLKICFNNQLKSI